MLALLAISASRRCTQIFFSPSPVVLSGPLGAHLLLGSSTGTGHGLLLLGDAIDAQEAWRIGLAHRVVRHEDLMKETYALAQRLKESPRYALGVTKQLLNREMQMELDAALEMEARAQAICMETADFREGYRAIVEKRAPTFNRS